MNKTTLGYLIDRLHLDRDGIDKIVRDYCSGTTTAEMARVVGGGDEKFQMILALAFGCRFGHGHGLHQVRGYILPSQLIITTTGTNASHGFRVHNRGGKYILFRAATVPDAAAWIRQQHGPHAFVDREELVREVKRRWRRRRELVLWLMQAENKDARMAEFAACCRTRLIDDLRARHGFAVEAVQELSPCP